MHLKKMLTPSHALFAVGLSFMLLSCNEDDHQPQTEQPAISYGTAVKVGDGLVKSFIAKNADGTVKEIGLKFSEETLNGLPAANTLFLVPMPADNKTPIDHISFDYSARGHEPDVVYGVPHFDMHFYMLSRQEVDAITLTDPKIDIIPAPEYIPKNYVSGGNEAKMGKHWADTTGHEFHGQNFTSTFIYGSYNGKFHFVEPMVSISYLKSKPNETMNVTLPAKLQQKSVYPQKYSVAWEKDRREYSIALNSLAFGQ